MATKGSNYVKKWRHKRAVFVALLKLRPCTDCGCKYPSYVMQFDHVRGQKLYDIAHIARFVGAEKLAAEIAKCDLVCANCHAERTFKRRKNRVVEY